MITLSESNKKLGDIKTGTETKFDVKVSCDKETYVKWIKVSCGCTTPKLSSNLVKPDTPSIMEVIFTPNSTGYTKKTIWLGYDENGEKREVKFDFEAFVE